MRQKVCLVLAAFTVFIVIGLALPASANAVCPVCTVTVVAGLGLSRWLGVDDLISGVWIGGLFLSASLWLTDWLAKKEFRFLKKVDKTWQTIFAFISMYLLVVIPLWETEVIGHPFNRFLGIDKLLFGIAVGVIAFALGTFADKYSRKKYGKQFLNYQKVIFPVAALIIGSTIMYLAVK
jgi:hypothetical protein